MTETWKFSIEKHLGKLTFENLGKLTFENHSLDYGSITGTGRRAGLLIWHTTATPTAGCNGSKFPRTKSISPGKTLKLTFGNKWLS